MLALEVLSLRTTFFGTVPPSLSNVTTLRRLKLHHNPIPTSKFGPPGSFDVLNEMPQLEELSLHAGVFSGPTGTLRAPNLLRFSVSSMLLPTFNLNLTFPATHPLEHLHAQGIGAYGSIATLNNLPNLKSLRLSKANINGAIDADLLPKGLEKVIIVDCPLALPLTPGIGLLTNLTTLDLENTLGRGSIPDTIGDCGALSTLRLADSLVTGSLPSSLGSLKKLVSLHVTSKLKLMGSIPESIGSLVSLRSLSLPFNAISGSIPSSMANLELEILDLQSNRLTGVIPNFAVLPHCEVDLSRNQLSGHIPDGLAAQCSVVSLANNKLGPRLSAAHFLAHGDFPSNFGSALPNQPFSQVSTIFASNDRLRVLDLSNNFFEGPLPLLLPPQNRTRVLELVRMENNIFDGELWESYCAVTTLDLSRNKLSAGLNHFLTCAGDSATLSSNKFALELFFDGNNTALTQLDLSGNQLTAYKMFRYGPPFVAPCPFNDLLSCHLANFPSLLRILR